MITITGKAPGATGAVANDVIVIGNEDDPDGRTTDTVEHHAGDGHDPPGPLPGHLAPGARAPARSANEPRVAPCVTATDNVVFVNQPIGPSFPLLGLISVLKASAVSSSTLANLPAGGRGVARGGRPVVNLPLHLGLNLAVTGVQTTATATMPPGTCGAPTLAGTSIVASLVLNGSVLVVLSPRYY